MFQDILKMVPPCEEKLEKLQSYSVELCADPVLGTPEQETVKDDIKGLNSKLDTLKATLNDRDRR